MSKRKSPSAFALRFKSRNYKHEIKLAPGIPRSVVHYTEAMWETLCREIASRDFTGIVFYSGAHPFEYLLDYSGFPEAAAHPAAENEAVRNAFNRGLAAARRHGLKTFIQHYVTHFTEPLAKTLGIPTTGRLANIEHPGITRYQRWCYREIFRQCPNLDGLYFNFESAGNAWDQVLNTALLEFNAMDRKPICVYRLWGLNDPEGVQTLIRTYKGRTILSHKVSDSADTYYLPVADSRVRDWKKILGDVEFMFCLGPCHNCGTNICDTMWGDYDFVQALLADAQKKGADSISFHTVHEFFAPEMNAPEVFSEHELDMARLNILHLDAVVDYVHGVRQTRTERAERMGRRSGVGPAAGAHLLDAVHASSQIIPLIYQQFCYGSGFDGYINPGRYSYLQDPFYYYPVTDLNDQATRLVWSPRRCDTCWLDKRLDSKVTPDNFLQYLIDAVNPAKPRAARNPRKLAAMLKANIDRSFAALGKYRAIAGEAAARTLELYVRRNAAVGEYLRHELLAAIQLYGVYFATSKADAVKKLKKGLAELEARVPLLDVSDADLKCIKRALLADLDPKPEIALAADAWTTIRSADFPFPAFRDYLDSRREYNEIRRICRAARWHDKRTLAFAAGQFAKAIRKAKSSRAALRDEAWRPLADNVADWLAFLETQSAQMTPPATVCTARPGEYLPMFWDHAFRSGENFIEDFLGFFRKMPLARESTLSLRLRRTPTDLVIAMRERDVDPKQRMAQWERHRGNGNDSFVERVFVDAEGKGRARTMFIVWPKGESVSRDGQPGVAAKTAFSRDETSTETTVWIPFALIGKRPKKGDVWGFNVSANPEIVRNHCYTWSPQYDGGGNPHLFGTLRFE